MALILGYWNIRGRGGVLRNLLDYCEIPFENHVYKTDEEWFDKDKKELPVPFPNIPYIKDGDQILTEVLALMNYVAIKAGRKDLIGDTDEKHIKVLQGISVINDLREPLKSLCWTKGNFYAEKEELFTKGKAKNLLEGFNKVYDKNEWLTGFFSIADFWLFEQVDLIFELEKSRLEEYPNLLKFHQRFLEIPKVQAHRASDHFITTWFLPGKATWTKPGDK